jgi:hypothetical protein
MSKSGRYRKLVVSTSLCALLAENIYAQVENFAEVIDSGRFIKTTGSNVESHIAIQAAMATLNIRSDYFTENDRSLLDQFRRDAVTHIKDAADTLRKEGCEIFHSSELPIKELATSIASRMVATSDGVASFINAKYAEASDKLSSGGVVQFENHMEVTAAQNIQNVEINWMHWALTEPDNFLLQWKMNCPTQ